MALYVKHRILGEGTFSQVFVGFHSRTQRPCILKMTKDARWSTLAHEATILNYLFRQSCDAVPILHFFDQTILVMSFYPKTLPQFSSKKVFAKNALSMLRCLESVHLHGVLHRDIKPDHFVLNETETKMVMIDFGFAIFCETQNLVESNHIIGSPKYCSIHVHDGKPFRKRDDLLSLIYIWIDWLLPESNRIEKKESLLPISHCDHPVNRSHKKFKSLTNLQALLQDIWPPSLPLLATLYQEETSQGRPNYNGWATALEHFCMASKIA